MSRRKVCTAGASKALSVAGTVAGCAGLVFLLVQFIEEPEGHMTEVLPDGTVQLIEVS